MACAILGQQSGIRRGRVTVIHRYDRHMSIAKIYTGHSTLIPEYNRMRNRYAGIGLKPPWGQHLNNRHGTGSEIRKGVMAMVVGFRLQLSCIQDTVVIDVDKDSPL